MNLRSGRTLKAKNLRRDSRNYEEFVFRKRYQEEQRQIEETLYEEEETQETILEKIIKNIFNKTRHLIYLNKCQNENKSPLSERINTVMELYEIFRYNIDYLIEYFNKKEDKRFPQAIFNNGENLCKEMASLVRTRKERKLYEKCKNDIGFVMYLLEYYILT